MQKVYVVITTSGYIPNCVVHRDRERAIRFAKDYAEEWDNEEADPSNCLYFNQEEEGNMDESVTVHEAELT